MNMMYKKDLTQDEMMFLETELNKVRKEKTPMWLLWFFTGAVGGQRYYLGDIGMAVCMTFFNWMTFGVWGIIDAFFINRRINKKNEEKEMEILTQIKMMRK